MAGKKDVGEHSKATCLVLMQAVYKEWFQRSDGKNRHSRRANDQDVSPQSNRSDPFMLANAPIAMQLQ